ncbi:MAG: putative transport system kinase [Ramlibacter sp.]|nr:putative transport system kinase [Ramlibacter sp.]
MGARAASSQGLIARARLWEPAAIGRLLSVIENHPERWPDLQRQLEESRPAGSVSTTSRVVGVTGPPGAGKSTLLDKLLENLVGRGMRAAVIAVDPSSPFSGGAVLGDRTRMGAAAHDPRVFIRSVASRGAAGGVADSTAAMLVLLKNLGFPVVIVESVGAGQSEIAIAQLTDFRIVLCPPGLGDDVQALKAGILEIADVLVISKGDLPGSELTEREMRSAVGLRRGRKPPAVMRVSAVTGLGVAELVGEIIQGI